MVIYKSEAGAVAVWHLGIPRLVKPVELLLTWFRNRLFDSSSIDDPSSMSGPGVPSTNSNALLSWQSPTTIAGTSISSSHEFQKPCVHITDISFSGHVACQLRISLVPSGNCDVEQALCGLPDLLSGHARIYELVAGDLTPSLANHLRPLLVGLPNTKPSLKSFLNLGDRCISNGSVRSQWAQASIPTSQWNPLHIPTIDSSEHKQYDNLDLSTSFALLSCRNKGVDKLLGEFML